jgi:hypothetical protein
MGEIITRRNWTELPVPMDVISRLKEMLNDRNSNIDEIVENEYEMESANDHETIRALQENNAEENDVSNNIEEEEYEVSHQFDGLISNKEENKIEEIEEEDHDDFVPELETNHGTSEMMEGNIQEEEEDKSLEVRDQEKENNKPTK